MSSLRNSLHRRNHKERSQLSHRQRFGILEKHKDYVLRARDYHSKQDRIRRLQQKAADRNKDEFYFGMNRERTEGGVHVQDRGNVSLPVDMVKILKTQDENYVRTMRATGLKKIGRLKEQLSALADLFAPILADDAPGAEEEDDTGLDEEALEVLRDAGVVARPSKAARKRRSSGVPARHVVFVENEEEARRYVRGQDDLSTSHPVDGDNVGPVDLGWTKPEKRRKGKKNDHDDAVDAMDSTDMSERRQAAKAHRTRLLKELSARLHRDRMLRYAERELEMQRLLMGKGRSKKLKGVERVGGKDDESEDEDVQDARRGKGSGSKHGVKDVDEKLYRPRVYKWRVQRKR